MNILRRQQTVHRVSLHTWRANTETSALRKTQEARNRVGLKLAANDSEAWKVRAVTYLEKHLAEGHELARRVGRMLHDLPKPRPELIAALSGAGSGENMGDEGVARDNDSLGILKSRLNENLDGPLGLIVFEHFLARVSDPYIGLHARMLLTDRNDMYFAAAAPNDIDEAYGLARTFRTTVFCLQGIGLERLRRGDGNIDVKAAAEHTVAVFASAYDNEAFIGVWMQ